MNKRSGKQAPCKRIKKTHLLHDFINKECLHKEIKIMQYVGDHPVVVSLHEAYEDEDYVHLVIDMCTGGDLFDIIINRKKTIPFLQAKAH